MLLFSWPFKFENGNFFELCVCPLLVLQTPLRRTSVFPWSLLGSPAVLRCAVFVFLSVDLQVSSFTFFLTVAGGLRPCITPVNLFKLQSPPPSPWNLSVNHEPVTRSLLFLWLFFPPQVPTLFLISSIPFPSMSP